MKTRLSMYTGLAVALLSLLHHAGHAGLPEDSFRTPPPETRPGCYWYWINDNISQAGITKDLEAMARVGIGRAYIGHIFNHKGPNDTPVGNVQFASPCPEFETRLVRAVIVGAAGRNQPEPAGGVGEFLLPG